MRRFLTLLLIVAAIGSACGGDGENAAPATAEEPAAEPSTTGESTTEPAETAVTETEPPTTTAEEAEPVATGRRIFLVAGCGNCHTLEAAGTTGTAGPNLDEHLAAHGGVDHIAMQIRQGGSGMPSFAGMLSDEEIRRVARFVHRATAE